MNKITTFLSFLFLSLLLTLGACSKDKDNVNDLKAETEISASQLVFNVPKEQVNGNKIILYAPDGNDFKGDDFYKLSAKINVSSNLQSDKIFYRTYLVAEKGASKNGLKTTNGNYEEYSLPADKTFVIKVKANEIGEYKYNIQFKDGLGKESQVYTFSVSVVRYINKDINLTVVEEKNGNSDVNKYQGGTNYFSFQLNDKFKENKTYKIKFENLTVNGNNYFAALPLGLLKFNGENVSFNEEMNFSVNTKNNVEIISNGFFGNIKVDFKVYEEGDENVFSLRKSIEYSLEKNKITLNQIVSSIEFNHKDESYLFKILLESFDMKGMQYKTWITPGNPRFSYFLEDNPFNTTNGQWKAANGNDFTVLNKPLYNFISSVKYDISRNKWIGIGGVFSNNLFVIINFHIQLKDRFGNESNVITFSNLKVLSFNHD